MLVDDGGSADLPEAAFRPLGGEPTIYSISPDRALQATRLQYQALESGVVYYLVVAGEGARDAALIAKVAGQWAATWNENAKVPGVTDIEETQETRPLGALEDVVNVAVDSTNGRFSSVITLRQFDTQPERFAAKVAAERATLDAIASST